MERLFLLLETEGQVVVRGVGYDEVKLIISHYLALGIKVRSARIKRKGPSEGYTLWIEKMVER